MYPVEERREGVGREGSGNGVELGGGESESVSVRELVEAVDDSVLEVLSRPGALGRGGAAERGSSGVGHCWEALVLEWRSWEKSVAEHLPEKLGGYGGFRRVREFGGRILRG